jgi:hypothetical protein
MKDFESCMDCVSHDIIKDPDPNDWFCDDDCAVVCTLMPNDDIDENSEYLSDRSPLKCITKSCRPHRTRVETTPIPKWCPNKNSKGK